MTHPSIPSFHRRAFLGGVLACATGGLQAQPATEPLRLLIGAAPGSAMDVAGRQIGEAFRAQTGQAVIVDNKPTAGGIQALDIVRRARPDEQIVGLVHAMQMTAAPALFPTLPYDPIRDFTHISILFVGQQVLVVPPSLPARRWTELIALAKGRQDGLTYATPSVGSPQHLSMELLRANTGIKLLHVPYRGPAAIQATLSGEVNMTLEGAALLLPHIQAGALVPLAIGGGKRLELLSDVPTFAELGVPGIGEVWVGLVAPPGLSATARTTLHSAMSRAMQSLKSEYQASGRIIEANSSEAMTDAIRRETPVWRDLVRSAGITPN